jgi:trans-AT polyketide synthase/acyltransferase/oxidoreductase domain-containing protein
MSAHIAGLTATGTVWAPSTAAPVFDPASISGLIPAIRETLHVVRGPDGARGVATGGQLHTGGAGYEHIATLGPSFPEWLGDRSFLQTHGVRFGYVAGAMANGIATVDLVVAMARAGMLGFYGAAGLGFERVESAIHQLRNTLDPAGLPWGSNLIHSPHEPALEERVADLYLRLNVRRVSASAYMSLTPAIVRYAASGLSVDSQGRIQRRNHVFAKISRPETARRFLNPAPDRMLQQLVERGLLTSHEAKLAGKVAVAEDYIVESDSGGHTDNQTLTALFPTIQRERDAAMARHNFERQVRLGAAGGLGTPDAVAAAFQLGAAFVLTGSVNQGAIESGLSDAGKVMLAGAGIADVVMAPAADMFELGVNVQVLQRGTMFAPRASRLYEIYRDNDGLHSLDDATRARLEKDVLGASIEDVWQQTADFWRHRDAGELAKAESDPKHQMALCFRWYLGLSSRWAIVGESARRLDYQIWCGPAMGAFNAWVKGSFLEPPAQRTAVQIARNLLEGAAVLTRAQQLRAFGVPVPTAAFSFVPRPLRT